KRKPRPADEKILSTPLTIRLVTVGIITALFSIAAYQWAKTTTGSAVIAQTMAMVIFSIVHIPFSLNLRYLKETVFQMETLSNHRLFYSFGWVLLALVLVTELPLLQKIFQTESLNPEQWSICLIAALLYLMVGEIVKVLLRFTDKTSAEG
ncbi:MAG: hypothetical protein GY797_07635, partial [Deltaproteobacteria bacterium]|nr:hypothetical protein [Deltaproteobacteria bacterium]